MSKQTCDCCELHGEQSATDVSAADRWLGDESVMNTSLPPDTRQHMSRFFDAPIETMNDVAAAIRAGTGGGSLSVDALCQRETETPHSATTGGETHYFECFFDGVALAWLADERVEIRTESPAGTEIEFTATPDGEVEPTPSEVVMSFGIRTDADPAAEIPSEELYAAICPTVTAFESRAGYERWADRVAAATVGLPLSAGLSMVAALTDAA